MERIGGRLKVSSAFLSPCLLKPGGIGLRIEFQSLLSVLEGFCGISGAAVISAQIYISRTEFAVPLLIDAHGLPVGLNRAGILAQRFLRTAQGVTSFDIRRV